mmetsp:Transcript_34658/g.87117  ORF Transcript_34658/g.87117 Transcript_34658/m.87117 type:complete len:223 (+) Transcript_34658:995-1663(+)
MGIASGLSLPHESSSSSSSSKKNNAGSKARTDSGRRKIIIEYIEDKSRRHITFSKRKAGIMKKAYELSTLTGTQVLLLVASETGHVYTFATPKLQPLIQKPEGKNLIQACLNAPDTLASDSMSVTPPSVIAAAAEAVAAVGGSSYAMASSTAAPPMLPIPTSYAYPTGYDAPASYQPIPTGYHDPSQPPQAAPVQTQYAAASYNPAYLPVQQQQFPPSSYGE